MNEANEKTTDRKRKKASNTDEANETSKLKKKIEFENDDEFEKYLLNHFKKDNKENENEYVFSELVKSFYNEIKKYKTVDDMANEIKKLAIQNISKNLEIICNNECTSSFFIEKFRVKYINEQIALNIKSAQNYFKEFMILYNNNNFDKFSLEINTNVEGTNEQVNEEQEQGEEVEEEEVNNQNKQNSQNERNSLDKQNSQNNKVGESYQNEKAGTKNALTKEDLYKTNTWKEKIKCKIDDINENNNILIKVVNYLSSIALHVDNIPIKITKFDIIKKFNELNFDILNINIWDAYNSKDIRPFSSFPSPSFYRKANLYFKKQTNTNEVLNMLREKPYSICINGWNLNNVKRNNYNYLDLRICPPICSHIERIKIDYENAKNIVRKLDKSCHINLDLLEDLKEETYFEDRLKKRRFNEESKVNDRIDDNSNNDKADSGKKKVEINNNQREISNSKQYEEESPIIQTIEENKDINITSRLDILILYLRLVHNFCYYSARKYNTYDEMIRECGYFYLRVNLDNKFYSNLTPIFYEDYNVSKLDYYVSENFVKGFSSIVNNMEGDDTNNSISRSSNNNTNNNSNNSINNDLNGNISGNLNHSYNENNNNNNLDYFKLLKVKEKLFNNSDVVSDYQLKWLLNFDEEIKDALKANYNENIDIEKTEEFFEILKKNYILKRTDRNSNNNKNDSTNNNNSNIINNNNSSSGNNKSEIRCAKCKKLFNNIKDVPNHIFIKHSQIKMKLITETEVQIMQRNFYEAPHSFHFLFMMEKKYNSNYTKNYLNKNFIKKSKTYKNQNFHLLPNNAKSDYKDFDDPSVNVFENVKQNVKTNNDFYDDT
ncbi:conserved Plasmodium protein, unknown function [Plasmodium malariae]|uniref:C2H2-type domain-containing protein n=1 Tax=Plasmodium malariae TaxID=5858 RepID=A0A1A8WAU3_PLAMA|nr:conserved Plasmodium protein, unknown function [Plasmodium malariae]SBS88321.1 conserved Plasmodium protein, unknown function [Plasmodium malariae]SCO93883.1 conserved Plasmodium protein, unknown function [Plasmodium malariae]